MTQQTNHSDLRNAARRLFNTPDGQQVLAALKARTLDRPTWPAAEKDGHALALMMAMREGENNLYRTLISLTKGETENHGK